MDSTTSGIDISDFAKNCVSQLYEALKASGFPRDTLKSYGSARAPFGAWNRPVFILLDGKPVAKYWLSYPTKDGLKTVKFNVETFAGVQKWLNLTPSSTVTEVP